MISPNLPKQHLPELYFFLLSCVVKKLPKHNNFLRERCCVKFKQIFKAGNAVNCKKYSINNEILTIGSEETTPEN